MLAGMFKIWVNPNRLPQIGHRPALGHQKPRPITQKNFSRAQVAPRAGRVFVIHGTTGARGHVQGNRLARVPVRGRQFIVGAHAKIDRGLLCHREVYGRSHSNRKRAAPFAANRELSGTRKAQPVSEEGHEQKPIPEQHRVEECPIPQPGNDPCQADPGEKQQSRPGSAAEPPVRLRRQFNRRGVEGAGNTHFGTSTAASTSVKTRSASRPSSSASGRNTIRWRSAGRTAAFTSSGIT